MKFQRHFPPVSLRHAYTAETIFTPPPCPLRTCYPLIEDPKLRPGRVGTQPESNVGTIHAEAASPIALARTVPPANQILCLIPGELQAQLGLDNEGELLFCVSTYIPSPDSVTNFNFAELCQVSSSTEAKAWDSPV